MDHELGDWEDSRGPKYDGKREAIMFYARQCSCRVANATEICYTKLPKRVEYFVFALLLRQIKVDVQIQGQFEFSNLLVLRISNLPLEAGSKWRSKTSIFRWVSISVSMIYQCWKNTAVFQDISKRHLCLSRGELKIEKVFVLDSHGFIRQKKTL